MDRAISAVFIAECTNLANVAPVEKPKCCPCRKRVEMYQLMPSLWKGGPGTCPRLARVGDSPETAGGPMGRAISVVFIADCTNLQL